LVQDQATKNVDALNRLAGCRSVQDFVTVQSDLMRDNLRQAIDTGRRVAEVSLRVAEEAAGIVQGQANRNADRARRVA
jgi:phasin family protein